MSNQLSQIMEGTFNNVTNRKEDLYNERIKICRGCKLLKKDEFFGEMCNSKLWVNPETDEVSYIPKDGFQRGCGCILKSKTRVPEAQCPIKK